MHVWSAFTEDFTFDVFNFEEVALSKGSNVVNLEIDLSIIAFFLAVLNCVGNLNSVELVVRLGRCSISCHHDWHYFPVIALVSFHDLNVVLLRIVKL